MAHLLAGLPFPEKQLQFMTWLAGIRSPSLDPFFRFLNYFDTPYFFFVLIPIIWLGYSYQWGLRIYYWFTLNSLLNPFVKQMVGWPRPCTDVPEIGMFHFTDNGFPSGGAQVCMFLGAVFIYYWRSRTAWIVGMTYILLISFSRLYLGVHYPIDILGGWAIAIAMFFLFINMENSLEKFLAKQGLFSCLVLSLLFPLILILVAPGKSYIAGSLVGAGLGTYFSLKYRLFLPASKTIAQGVYRSSVGLAFIFLFVFFWPSEFPLFSKSFATAFFLSLAASPICKWAMTCKTCL